MIVNIRRVFVSLLTLLLIALMGGWLYVQSLLSSLKPSLEAALGDQLGGEVSIQSVNPQIFPALALEIQGVEISRGPACQAIASVERAQLHMQLRPLLSKQLLVELIRFENPTFRISVGASGELLGMKGSPCNPAPHSASEPPSLSSPLEMRLSIKNFEIEDGQVSLRHEGTQHNLIIKQAHAEVTAGSGAITVNQATVIGVYNQAEFSVTASDFSLHENGSARLETGILTIAGQTLSFGASRSPGPEGIRAHAECASLDIAKLIALLDPGKRRYPQGRFAAKLIAHSAESGELTIEGHGSLKDLSLTFPELALKGLHVKSVKASLRNGHLIALSTDTSITSLRVADQSDRYEVDDASFNANISIKPGNSLTSMGKALVKGFSFRNEQVLVSKADASLNAITLEHSDKRGTNVKLTVDGSSVVVRHPIESSMLEVSDVQRVSAPLSISVPAQGGYKVEGPVTVESATVVLHGRKLEKLSGTVAMALSGPQKTFRSSKLQGTFGSHRLGAGIDFLMSPAAYRFNPSTLTLDQGVLRIQGELMRQGNRPFTIDVFASELPLPGIAAVVDPTSTKGLKGNLSELTANLSGGLSDWKSTLTGIGSMKVAKPAVEGFSLSRTIGSAVESIPGVSGDASTKLGDDLASTPAIEARMKVREGSIFFEPFVLRRRDFTVRGQGTVDFQGQVKANAKVIFLGKIVSALGLGFEPLKRMLGRAESLSIPILLEGTVPDVNARPDMTQLAKQLSGISLAQDALSATASVGNGVLGVVTKPFSPNPPPRPTP